MVVVFLPEAKSGWVTPVKPPCFLALNHSCSCLDGKTLFFDHQKKFQLSSLCSLVMLHDLKTVRIKSLVLKGNNFILLSWPLPWGNLQLFQVYQIKVKDPQGVRPGEARETSRLWNPSISVDRRAEWEWQTTAVLNAPTATGCNKVRELKPETSLFVHETKGPSKI